VCLLLYLCLLCFCRVPRFVSQRVYVSVSVSVLCVSLSVSVSVLCLCPWGSWQRVERRLQDTSV
jgi:hypothetical protein